MHPAMARHVAELMMRPPRLARSARRWAAEVLSAWGATGMSEAAESAVSELAAIADLHGSARLDVRICLTDEILRLELIERTDTAALVEVDPVAAELLGTATPVLDAVTNDWGQCPLPGGGALLWADMAVEHLHRPRQPHLAADLDPGTQSVGP